MYLTGNTCRHLTVSVCNRHMTKFAYMIKDFLQADDLCLQFRNTFEEKTPANQCDLLFSRNKYMHSLWAPHRNTRFLEMFI